MSEDRTVRRSGRRASRRTKRKRKERNLSVIVVVLVAAVLKEDNSTEVITDLTDSEKGKFEVVNTDDARNMRLFLTEFDGDFLRLFS